MKTGLFIIGLIVLEILSFIIMADLVGAWRTILLVILSMGAGFVLFRSLGEQMSFAQMQAMRTGQMAPNFNPKKMYLFLVAILLIIPGFFSDILALLLLIPWVRQLCAKLLKIKMAGFKVKATNSDHVTIDGEFIDLDKDKLEEK